MSVLIKNIGIPKSCAECRFCVNGFTDEAPVYECACESYDNVSVLVDDNGEPLNIRPDWCSLIEVPDKHGRLIDADSFKETLDYYIREAGWSDKHNEALTWVKDDFLDAEATIIEAEGRQ